MRHFGRRLAGLAVLLIPLQACGGNSSTVPSPVATPDFQGQFTGSYVVTSCTETGVFFSGFCAVSGWSAGTFPLELSLAQNRSAVTGTITLHRGPSSPLRGTFQGAVQSGGDLTGTATLPALQLGGTITRAITAWDATIAASALSGGFTLVHRSGTEAGAMTVTAALAQVTRQ